jgi:glycosyltransferase involved in cell wall biosynthesis
MRVLFFNEGNLGSHILGQRQLEAALRTGLGSLPGVQARFAGLTPMGRLARAASQRSLAPLQRRDLDFRALRWHLVQSLRARGAIRRELQAWPADLVHIHTQSVALAAGGIMRVLPVVLSVDTTIGAWAGMPAWAPERHPELALAPSRALERRALRQAALVVAWTDWARRDVEREQPQARAITLHPGLDLQRYTPAPRQERDRLRVLFVGGRFAQKGGEDLLHALDGLLGERLELDLVTPADVPPRPGLRLHRLESSDPQLLELYRQADVLALPTYGDATPWALLEGMACGAACVSTRIGAIPEMLDEGRAGVLIRHGDVRELREALAGLLADPQRRAALGARARERCEQRYDARRQVPTLVEQLRALAPR